MITRELSWCGCERSLVGTSSKKTSGKFPCSSIVGFYPYGRNLSMLRAAIWLSFLLCTSCAACYAAGSFSADWGVFLFAFSSLDSSAVGSSCFLLRPKKFGR